MTPLRRLVTESLESLHDETTRFFTQLDGGGTFREDRWERPGGGGGVARVLEGVTFEKAGVNRSAVEGILPAAAAQRVGARASGLEEVGFYATGMSLVLHPRSPMIPTVHLNVRYFEITDPAGEVRDAWLGGGTDLTPTYPFEEDAAHFHRTLKTICDRHHSSFYLRFKTWCDHYFVNTHRGDERRGIGGVFFDNLRDGEAGLGLERLVEFLLDVGRALPLAYAPIVARRRELEYGERERHFQLVRRGRYAEFNLLHDRGTVFGLQTNARTESVLMSLPPVAAWDYAPSYPPGSFEAELLAMLEPRNWAEPAG
ncbi:MAG TPA: oxygen-dependent coproporphyrinogen oxidase [Gemmatimonadales bacterium]|jgi:coproporphyrinogen III oxidase|nr:oxygen-dependent coproporphyrinogen oxidase [Gemmatimonadales bacterium]